MLAIILVIIIGIGSVYLLGNDNPVEEIAEKVIEEEIWIDVDLTPNSKENIKSLLGIFPAACGVSI